MCKCCGRVLLLGGGGASRQTASLRASRRLLLQTHRLRPRHGRPARQLPLLSSLRVHCDRRSLDECASRRLQQEDASVKLEKGRARGLHQFSDVTLTRNNGVASMSTSSGWLKLKRNECKSRVNTTSRERMANRLNSQTLG